MRQLSPTECAVPASFTTRDLSIIWSCLAAPDRETSTRRMQCETLPSSWNTARPNPDRSIRSEHRRNGCQHRSSVSETRLRSRPCGQPFLPSARNQTGIPASGCRRFHRPRQTEVSASQRRFHARSRNGRAVGLLRPPVDWTLNHLGLANVNHSGIAGRRPA